MKQGKKTKMTLPELEIAWAKLKEEQDLESDFYTAFSIVINYKNYGRLWLLDSIIHAERLGKHPELRKDKYKRDEKPRRGNGIKFVYGMAKSIENRRDK